MLNKSKIFLTIVLSQFILFHVNAQTSCIETTDTLVEPDGKTTLCTNDAVELAYNPTGNTSTLPNYAYVVEGPNGLLFLEDGDPPLDIIPAQLGAIDGDTLCVSGFAYDIAQVNNLIASLSNSLVCILAGIDAATCQIIADLNAQGGLSSLNEALNFAATLGATPPATTEEAITLLIDVDTQASALGGLCVAVSNNGMGKDYCYTINCCTPQIVNLNEVTIPSDYVAQEVICLDIGFFTGAGFYATIEDCP